MKNLLFFKKNKGFTIIELSVAIFILSISIIGAYNAFTTMDKLTSNSSDRFVAAYLAQEGLEIIRNIRDSNWLRMDTDPSITWVSGISDQDTDCTIGCEVDYKTLGTADSPLYPWTGRYFYINEEGFYTYNQESAIKTKFKRKITITPLETAEGVYDVIKITVQVFWDEKSNILHNEETEDYITAEEYLYNWY